MYLPLSKKYVFIIYNLNTCLKYVYVTSSFKGLKLFFNYYWFCIEKLSFEK